MQENTLRYNGWPYMKETNAVKKSWAPIEITPPKKRN